MNNSLAVLPCDLQNYKKISTFGMKKTAQKSIVLLILPEFQYFHVEKCVSTRQPCNRTLNSLPATSFSNSTGKNPNDILAKNILQFPKNSSKFEFHCVLMVQPFSTHEFSMTSVDLSYLCLLLITSSRLENLELSRRNRRLMKR
jgi:hypothetical protein